MLERTGLSVSTLSRRYGRQWAVRQISVEFPSGGVHVVIGHNGAGKSTLLALLAGALRPTEGLVTVLGIPWEDADADLRARVAWLPHKPFVYPDLTGREMLAFVGRLYGREVGSERLDELLEQVGLSAAGHRKVRTYSRGMTQRLALAGVVAQDAEVWLLDEPATGLDEAGREMLTRLLREAREAGRCVVVVTHDPSAFSEVTDSLYRLERGRLVQGEGV